MTDGKHSNWVGGPLFIKQKKWNNGKNNSRTPRRFPLMLGSKQQSDRDKKKFQENPRPIKIFKSKAKGMFQCIS